MDLPESAQKSIAAAGQEHLVRFWDGLSETEQRSFVKQLEGIDFELMTRLMQPETVAGSEGNRVDRAKPPGNLVRQPQTDVEREEWKRADAAGRELLKARKVGAILVAGGQGTRLGFDKPKGMFPVGPLSQKSLYQWFAEQLQSRSRQCDTAIPYLIMTSDATHDETVAYFKENGFFGLNPADVFFFQQGTLPAAELNEPKLLLDQKGSLSLSPDGHGGLLKSLSKHGLLEEMTRRGIEHLYYHQVDNATAPFCDPAFLGWHVLKNSELSTKVVKKVGPEERMGVVCDVDGHAEIIEYSDLTSEQSKIKTPDGRLLFWAGNTAIHVFSTSFLRRLVEEAIDLPYHIAKKAVPSVDASGQRVTPGQPNARKFEQFIFDALPIAENALVVEVNRAQEFNPIKNKEGSDSPSTARAALVANHRAWLESAGAKVASGVTVEIAPRFAGDADDVKKKVKAGTVFDADTVLDEAGT
jgi:UDP-N-acetylglucosamine/UDP-N-acetylgalactosamine diphosphorylase